MGRKIITPKVPKLFKILSEDQSCNGGKYTWKTDGSINELPAKERRKRLGHCETGFHLTTDWLCWYKLGRDVYTAIVPGGEILLKQVGRVTDNKVVAARVSLTEKNQDPLARLLKDFYNDALKVEASFSEKRANRGEITPKGCIRFKVGLDFTRLSKLTKGSIDCGILELFYTHRAAWYIADILYKSVRETISDKDRKRVHDIWNLYKKGWYVHGILGDKYVVN